MLHYDSNYRLATHYSTYSHLNFSLDHLRLILSLVLCLCSSLSKEMGVTVVAIFVVYEFFILNKVQMCSVQLVEFFHICMYVCLLLTVFPQMDLASTLKLLNILQSQPKQLPKWFVRFLLRVFVITVFVVMFLVLRLKLNQGSPPFMK